MSRLLRKLQAMLTDSEANEGTTYRENPIAHPPAKIDGRSLFLQAWPDIDRALATHRELGVVALVLDETGRAVAEAYVQGDVDTVRALVLGRHSECWLQTPGSHSEISLRHIGLLVRAISFDKMRLRLVDLHTAIGFSDESGRSLQAATVTGSAFVAVGRLRVALLVTGDPNRARDPEQAYAKIPERVFFEKEEGVRVEGGQRRASAVPADGVCDERTRVTSERGPVAATSELMQDGEAPAGYMTLEGRGMAVTRVVGPSALRRGILIGRYSRCDVRTGEESYEISRVHTLVVEEGQRVWAIDTASTNGTWVGQHEIHATPLLGDKRVRMGNGENALSITWSKQEPRTADFE